MISKRTSGVSLRVLRKAPGAMRSLNGSGTLAARGLLIEEARTNLVLQSEDFATTWGQTASPIVSTNTTVAPDNTTTGDTIGSTATGSYVFQSITFTGDGTKAFSIFIKQGTSTVNRLFVRDTTAGINRGLTDVTWTVGVPSEDEVTQLPADDAMKNLSTHVSPLYDGWWA